VNTYQRCLSFPSVLMPDLLDDGTSRLSVVTSEAGSQAQGVSLSRSQSEILSPSSTVQLVAAIHGSFSPLSDVPIEEDPALLQGIASANPAPDIIRSTSNVEVSASTTQTFSIAGPSLKPPSRRVPLFEQDLVLDASVFGTRRDRKIKQRALSPSPVETPARDEIPAPVIIHEADGTVVLEEIDSPAIRRKKNMERKAQKSREVTGTSSHRLSRPPTANSHELEPGQATSTGIEIEDNEMSELSELSDFDDDEGHQHLIGCNREEASLDSGIDKEEMATLVETEDAVKSLIPETMEDVSRKKPESPVLDLASDIASTPQNTSTSIMPSAAPDVAASSSVSQPASSASDSAIDQPKKSQSLPTSINATTSTESQRPPDDHEIAQIMILLADSSRDPARSSSHRRASVSILPEASASSVEWTAVNKRPSSLFNETRRTVSGPLMQSISATPTRPNVDHRLTQGHSPVVEDSSSRTSMAETIAGPSRVPDPVHEDLSVDTDNDGKVKPGTIGESF
jgi:hypothetical protein